ncbi:hypothetical protein [Paenibacillus sp. NAIST15-1]|uniref:hypothetical protein n=1 Tax=Paenibacillus sp. NAIST15-1 TaxID=1605994 RepID=UPI0008686402|nr:hypothetical protein [Paenibacillus sp. NAIST15-1]GAV13381.1 hypothetical protein PBN151_3316 [Paenibacillus sp. NAIST15-1]
MDRKEMGFADRVIFILGLTLAGVLTFVLLVGVIVAILKFFMERKERTIQVQPAPMLKDDPKAPLESVSTSEQLSEEKELQLNDEQERPPN